MERRLLYIQKRISLETNITKLCKNFRLHELEEHVLPIFRKVTWNQVLYFLKRNKKPVSLENIAQVLILRTEDEPYAFLEDMYFEMYLTHKIVHSTNCTWYAFKMFGGEGKYLVTATQNYEALKNAFRSLTYAPVIKVKLIRTLTWVMIVQRKRKESGKEPERAFVCAYTPGEHYFFASQKNIKTDISNGLLSAFGYRRLNDCNLSSSDIASMITLLRNKYSKAFDAYSVQHAVDPYTPGAGVATEDGMDFTNEHLKKNYADLIFGKDCPVLEKFSVREIGPMVKNRQTYRTSFTIRSTHVFEFLKQLLVRGVIVMPLSPYIERIRTIGTNNIEIKWSTESQSQEEEQN